jgi:predicted nucleic acid-binding protein
MIYLDTSYIVKCYVSEPGSEQILAWLEGRRGLVCSWHGRIELYSAFHRHFQAGRLTAAQVRKVTRQLEADEADGIWSWLAVTPALIRQGCCTLAGLDRKTCLRAADALHLAIAADAGCEGLYSHDRHLLEAAAVFGVTAHDIL